MCLDKITRAYKPKKGYKVGWSDSGGNFAFLKTETRFDKWVMLSQLAGIHYKPHLGEHAGRIERYVLGFHIIKTLKDARRFLKSRHGYLDSETLRIYPCEYVGVLAEGHEDYNCSMLEGKGIDVVVAACVRISSTPVK